MVEDRSASWAMTLDFPMADELNGMNACQKLSGIEAARRDRIKQRLVG
jgi:hypothetical protein